MVIRGLGQARELDQDHVQRVLEGTVFGKDSQMHRGGTNAPEIICRMPVRLATVSEYQLGGFVQDGNHFPSFSVIPGMIGRPPVLVVGTNPTELFRPDAAMSRRA